MTAQGNDALKRPTSGQILRTQAAVNATALVDSADAVLLPAVFRAFELEFRVGPSTLGNISLCQALAQSLSSPMWGYLADNVSRRKLLASGCLIVGCATLLVSQGESIAEIALGRAVAGFGLAIVGPIAQSLIADLFLPSRRGLAYGLLGVTAGVGSMSGTIFATSMSTQMVGGMIGWRFAFICVAMLELFMSLVVILLATDPPRGGLDDTVPRATVVEEEEQQTFRDGKPKNQNGGSNSGGADAGDTEGSEGSEGSDEGEGGEEEEPHERQELLPPSQPSRGVSLAGLRLWLARVVTFFKIRTFVYIVLQGLAGIIPWNAFVFITLFLQYVGFSDREASTIFSFIYVGGMLGQMLGGWLGDHMSAKFPNHGRVFTAQLSVLLAIPSIITFFHVLPRDPDQPLMYTAALFTQGLVCTWASPACNRPILSEVVDPHSRSSVFAVLIAMEGATGAFGAPVVGVLAERVFGYVRNDLMVSQMTDQMREDNLNAIANAATVVMVVPWLFCFWLYGLVHSSYPKDKAKPHMS